jgi:hypothetical protein
MQQFFDTLLNGPARYTQEHHLGPGWTLVVVLGALLVEFGIVYALVRLLIFIARQTVPTFRWVLRRFGVGDRHIDYTFLQLTFPATTTKSAYATEQLHILMRSLVKYYSFWERVAARKQPYSLELVATEDDGIRYVIRVSKQEADIVRRTLLFCQG